MAITAYLAMTAAEVRNPSSIPEKIAWMACHFSPYSTGISNLPENLPEGSMLILNDVTPIHGHDPERIAKQLTKSIKDNKCMGLLLDFQREGYPELEALAKYLNNALPCPVAYFGEHNGPVFLPPVPCHVPIEEYITKWKNREIWLEVALDRKAILLTESGSRECTPPLTRTACQHRDSRLHCSYDITVQPGQVLFSMQRTVDDLQDLLSEAEELGVQKAFGLYQELGEFFL